MSRLKAFFINRKILLLGFPLVLIVLLAGSVFWLLNTASGAMWLWERLETSTAVDVSASRVTGDLASGLVLETLEYRSENLDFKVRHAELEAGPGWWPVSIEVRRLSLQDVEVVTRSVTNPQESANDGGDVKTILGHISLPLPLEIQDAEVIHVIVTEDGQPLLVPVESIHLRAALDERLVVEHLEILTKDFETRAQGHLELEPPFEVAVNMEGHLEIAAGTDGTPFSMPFNLEGSGNLDSVQFSLSSLQNGLQLGGEILDPLVSPAWDITAALDRLSWPQGNTEQAVTLSDLNLVSQGNIDDWSFVLGSGLQAYALKDVQLAVSGSGSSSGIQIENAALTGPGMDVGINGRLDWFPETEAVLKTAVRQLDLSPWLSDWPAGERLTGDVQLSWSGASLQIPASQLAVTGTGLVARIAADIDLEANRVEASLDWRNLSWPLTAATAAFSSESGQLNINGSADDWVADGQLDIKVGEYPQGRFKVQGNGDRTTAHLVIPGGEILGGRLSGEADADWTDILSWDASIKAQGINPEPLLSGWPGELDSDIEISAEGLPQQTQINIVTLQGLLRDVAISARGGLVFTDDGLVFKRLEVHTDEAVLKLDGAMADPAGATVGFSGYLPSRLLGGARGNLELEGRYSSITSQPLLELQLQALDLAWEGLGVAKLAINTPAMASSGVLPALQLDASELTFNDMHFDGLSMSFSPVGESIELKAKLSGERMVLSSLMDLTPGNTDELLSKNWKGVIKALDVEVGPAYIFELSKPAPFASSGESALLGPFCLSENTGATLCLNLDYQNNGDWSLVADASALPLDYLRDILELDVHFEQLLEGHMEWHQSHDRALTGGAGFRITAGRILDLLDDEVLAVTNEGRFAFTLQDGNLESGVLDIEFPGTGFIDVDFNVMDIVGEEESKLQGSAVARLDHLTLVGQLALPGVDAVDGQFETNLKLGGSLAHPDIDGGFKFHNGLVQYAPIGLKLEDIEIDGQVERRDSGNFKGRFKAGEGVATIDGRFLFDDIGRARMEVDLEGGPLLLINTTNLKVQTETKLQISMSQQRMDINGHITVPSARLTAANMPFEEVRDSEDLVMETQGVESEPDTTEMPAKIKVYGKLETAFGDDVFIKVPGVETYVGGSTTFNWNGDPIPMAQGGYLLNGKVDIYGPTLKIDNGSISFPDVPADNPLLHIRAGREIYGNTQIRSAGVQVIGSLKRPVLEAYTVPLTNEDRAWTLLVTGTDFDQGQGVSGFDVGTYLAPKLYVSYGISLFDNENVISARYDLKKGFGVKVTSGQRETGLDVSYTIDR